MIRSFMRCSWCNVDSGLLVLRIGVGLIFIAAGWMKAADLDLTVGFFASVGFAPFWAYLVTAVELLGGISMVLGIYARVAAQLFTIVMIVAIIVSPKDIAVIMTPVMMLFSNVALLLTGGGAYSLVNESCGARSDSEISSQTK